MFWNFYLWIWGWSNNKTLEIYNPTANSIDLSNYFVVRFSNGSTSASYENIQLSGTIAPYDVFVATLDKQDPNGTGNNAPVWSELQNVTDGFFCPDYNTSNAFYFNGDDAVVLALGDLSSLSPGDPISNITYTPVDIIGVVGQRPTNTSGGTSQPTGGWSTSAPYQGGPTGGVPVTVDHSLVRHADVKQGVSGLVTQFNPLAEWDLPPVIDVIRDEPMILYYKEIGQH